MSRFTVSLDDPTDEMLDYLLKKYGGSKSEIIRKAIKCFFERDSQKERIDETTLKFYLDHLKSEEHLLFDISFWRIFTHLLQNAPEECWKRIREVGYDHGEQYKDKIDSAYEFLRVLEMSNWLHIHVDRKGKYTLIPRNIESMDLIKTFLETVFERIEIPIKIEEGVGKLRVLEI